MCREFNILVLSLVSHLPKTRKVLESAGRVDFRPELSKNELIKIIYQYDVLITRLDLMIDREVIDHAQKLRLIATPSTGTDHIDMDYARRKGIIVESIKNDHEILKTITSTAELAFCLMISCMRKIPAAYRSVQRGNWSRNMFLGREINGRILGIIGYGRLGEIFSRYARAFNMEILVYDPQKIIADSHVRQVQLNELLHQSEVITIHVHLTPETRNLIGREQFKLMRDGVYLINTSRGAIIDEDAFLNALKCGKVAGAGIDVISNEIEGDIKSNPLVKYASANENLIITPHVGGCTYEAQEKAFLHLANKISSFLGRLHLLEFKFAPENDKQLIKQSR